MDEASGMMVPCLLCQARSDFSEWAEFKWDRDLEWYDGPLSSVFMRGEVPWLAHWGTTDTRRGVNTWLFAKTTMERVEALTRDDALLRDVLMESPSKLLIDVKNGRAHGMIAVPSFPEEWLPEPV